MIVTAVAVAGLVVLLTGCSDDADQGSDAQAATEGLQEEVVEGVRFGYPQGWSGSVPSTEANFAVAGPDGANGALSELRFSYDERDIDAPFEERYQITVGSIGDRAFGFEELEERDVEVPGALGALALGISNVGDTDTALGTKVLAGAFGTAVVGIFGIVLTVLWRARWSIDRDGIVLAMGRARRIPWSQVSALRLTGSAGGTSGSGARSYVHIELRGTERKSTHTPSRLREAPADDAALGPGTGPDRRPRPGRPVREPPWVW